MDTELVSWVETQLSALTINREQELGFTPVTGDAGFRCYFRLNTQPSLLAVDSPPETEKNPEFVAVAELLCQLGVHAPKVYAWDKPRGYMLVEDLGRELYLPHLNSKSVDGLYRQAMDTLIQMQRLQQCPAPFPLYDRELLQREMALLPEWFVPQLLGVSLTDSDRQVLSDTFEFLSDSALEQPQVLVHRDFHSRNLLLPTEDKQMPGVVDFQDAVWGGCTYDLVSLLRDCYIRWPRKQVEAWVVEFKTRAQGAGLYGGLYGDVDKITDAQFIRWFDLMGLQRHIKVLGIFARLYLRDNKPGYLNDLPLVMHYTLNVARRYPELAAFVELFQQKWLPKAQECDWYSDIAIQSDERGALDSGCSLSGDLS